MDMHNIVDALSDAESDHARLHRDRQAGTAILATKSAARRAAFLRCLPGGDVFRVYWDGIECWLIKASLENTHRALRRLGWIEPASASDRGQNNLADPPTTPSHQFERRRQPGGLCGRGVPETLCNRP